MRVNLRYLQNTLEQLVLFVPGVLGLAIYCSNGRSMRAVVATTAVWIVTRIAFWIGYHRSSAQRGIGAPGMILSMVVLLYVCSRFGFEIAGPVGAIVPLVLFGGAEAVLASATKPLSGEAKEATLPTVMLGIEPTPAIPRALAIVNTATLCRHEWQPRTLGHSEHWQRFRRPGTPRTPRTPELLSVLPYDRGGRFEANADSAALVDEGTLGSNPPDDILGRQYRRHFATASRRSSVTNASASAVQSLRRDTRDRHLAGGAADAQALWRGRARRKRRSRYQFYRSARRKIRVAETPRAVRPA